MCYGHDVEDCSSGLFQSALTATISTTSGVGEGVNQRKDRQAEGAGKTVSA
jgi:hypothetical protein